MFALIFITIFPICINICVSVDPEEPSEPADHFNDYQWLPQYKSQYGDACQVFHVESNQNLCFNLFANDLSDFAKMEVLATNPLVYILHGVLREYEIDQIIAAAIKNTNVLEVQDESANDTSKSRVDPSRVAKGAWLFDDVIPARNIKTRYGRLTGFNMAYAEAMHVIFYEPGGHYAPHYDYLVQNTPETTGNRLATILTFLGEPEEGGATAFPKLGFSVYPTKGSAVVWFNMNSLGGKEYNSIHGGCPVWKGQKYVATIWIREKGNEMDIKCDKQGREHYAVSGFSKGIIPREIFRIS